VVASPLDTRYMASPPPSAESIGAAVLGPLLLGLLGALACWPTAALAWSLHGDPAAGARAGVLWTLVPGVALMIPELDQALALPVVASAAALAAALRPGAAAGPSWAVHALAAGVLAAIAVFFSYGAGVFVLLGGLAVLAFAGRVRRAAAVVGLALAGAGAVVILERLAGHRPLASALTALAIHRHHFTARRSYLTWLAFDPVDLFWFVGPPVALLVVAAGLRAAMRVAARGGASPVDRFQAAAVLGVGVLIVSGIVRGEVGRIFIPVMPLLLVAAVAGKGSAAPGATAGPSVAWAVLLGVLLTATCLVIRLTWDVP
jgi:hypothetical protein